MAPRTSWKGYLKLSLVSVPVRAFTANNTSAEIRLNQLHEECNSRVKYKKVCPEHGELQSSDIVSGYEYAKDQYVIVKPEEVAKLRKQADKSVHIEGFVKTEDIDPRYFAGKTYYLLPDGVAGSRPYALLHDGMASGDVAAIARAVLSGREQLVLLRTMGRMLALSVLHWDAQVKDVEEFADEVEELELADEEKALTQTLIQASYKEDFDPAAYKDTYADELKQLIQAKVDGEEIVEAPQSEEPQIINLMDALKKSVAQANLGGGDGGAGAAASKKKKKAASKTGGARKAPVRKKRSG